MTYEEALRIVEVLHSGESQNCVDVVKALRMIKQEDYNRIMSEPIK